MLICSTIRGAASKLPLIATILTCTIGTPALAQVADDTVPEASAPAQADDQAPPADQVGGEAAQQTAESSPTEKAGTTTEAPAADGAKSESLSAAELAEINAALAGDAQAATEANGDASGGAPAAASNSSMNPDISVVLDVAAAYFSKDGNLQMGGHDPTETGFNLQQLELSISQDVDPYFRFNGNIVFGSDGVEIEEAYATTIALPHSLQLRAGQILSRMGRINETHPHSWSFVDQPLVLGRYFGADGNRGLGVELSYLTPLPFFLELVTAANDARTRSFFGDPEESLDPLPTVQGPSDFVYSVMAKSFFELSSNWSLLTGLSFLLGPNATADDAKTLFYAADVFFKYRPITRASTTVVELQTEWFNRQRQVNGRMLWDISGYVHGQWRFARRWAVAARYELGTPARTKDGDTGLDDLDPEWTKNRQRGAVSVSFWPTEFSRLRLQGSADYPEWQNEAIFAGFLALEVVVGAHGAHSF